VRGQGRQPGGDQSGHALGERQPDVHLGQAEVAAVGAHHALVAGQGQHRPGGEGVAVDRRQHGQRRQQHLCDQLLGLAHHALGLPGLRAGHPFQVQAVGEELARSGEHHRARALRALGFVERLAQRPQGVRVEAVLAVVHAQDGHRPGALGD
jgi:hypothetical protein